MHQVSDMKEIKEYEIWRLMLSHQEFRTSKKEIKDDSISLIRVLWLVYREYIRCRLRIVQLNLENIYSIGGI